jgi:hypothetical protein
MTRTTSFAPLGSEFDSFLFAPVGEDKNGRLIALPPRQTGSSTTPLPQALHGTGQGANSRVVSYAILIVLDLLLGAQFIIASRAPQANSVNTAPASSTVTPDMPPPSSVQ